MREYISMISIFFILISMNSIFAQSEFDNSTSEILTDSTFTITDSLLIANTPPSAVVLFPAIFAAIPGMGTFGLPAISLVRNSSFYQAQGVFVLGTISYSFFIGHGINKIRWYNKKQKLLKEYSEYKIIDKSTIKKETTPSFYLHYGLHRSLFDRFDSDFKISWNMGMTYNYPISSFLSINTGMFFTQHNISMKDIVYRPEDAREKGYMTLMDVDYKAFDLTFPVGLQVISYRKDDFNLFLAFDYTIVLNSHRGKIKNEEKFVPQNYDDYDFCYSEMWFIKFNEELIYSIGFNKSRYQVKFSYARETKTESRSPGNYVYIYDKLNVFELQFGFRLF